MKNFSITTGDLQRIAPNTTITEVFKNAKSEGIAFITGNTRWFVTHALNGAKPYPNGNTRISISELGFESHLEEIADVVLHIFNRDALTIIPLMDLHYDARAHRYTVSTEV